jgi:hypothetical protein
VRLSIDDFLGITTSTGIYVILSFHHILHLWRKEVQPITEERFGSDWRDMDRSFLFGM